MGLIDGECYEGHGFEIVPIPTVLCSVVNAKAKAKVKGSTFPHNYTNVWHKESDTSGFTAVRLPWAFEELIRSCRTSSVKEDPPSRHRCSHLAGRCQCCAGLRTTGTVQKRVSDSRRALARSTTALHQVKRTEKYNENVGKGVQDERISTTSTRGISRNHTPIEPQNPALQTTRAVTPTATSMK